MKSGTYFIHRTSYNYFSRGAAKQRNACRACVPDSSSCLHAFGVKLKVCSEALNPGSDALPWMSDGKLNMFHRIIDHGKKLVSVDDFLRAGTGYSFFRKL